MTKLLFFILLFITDSFASILVLEFKPDDAGTWHGEEVAAIACNENCPTLYTNSFSEENLSAQINKELKNASIINMSFSVFEPSHPWFDSSARGRRGRNVFDQYESDLEKYEAALIEFESDKASLKKMIGNNPDKLFVIASGNGVLIDILLTPGMALSEENELYPQFFVFQNSMNVAAINTEKVSFDKLETYELTRYANYGLDSVDIAAPVELNRVGEIQKGTSFAAPYIARLAQEVKEKLPHFNSLEIKEVLMKSVYVKNIEKAIWATQDLNKNGRNSIVYKAQFEKNYSKKIEFQKSLDGIMLVKSGGFILSELVLECIQNIKDLSVSIEEACLMAHQKVMHADEKQFKNLKNLWDLRSF